ncbi:hypothetical protein SCHIN_v1c00550 [Spiroplasma chinense]|uniref:Uncharacterized protein n=1 Tax=Spiroplasma chinense TaxID=216932 RepID=A0A5B9Y3C3_9MOLU|nr:hypothetical protein [Spiroplasma chinense]QEH61253.1 hypothetical protein SCHIN_v1c00550 [Spiroplasma chinense]
MKNRFSTLLPICKISYKLLASNIKTYIMVAIFILGNLGLQIFGLYFKRGPLISEQTYFLVFYYMFNYLVLGLFSVYLWSLFFKSETAKNIITLEQRYGYKGWSIFFTRFLIIILINFLLIFVVLITSSFFLIGNTTMNSTYFSLIILPYFVMLFLALTTNTFFSFVFNYFNKVSSSILAWTLIFLMAFSGIINRALTQIIDRNRDQNSASLARINANTFLGWEFYNKFSEDNEINKIYESENLRQVVFKNSDERIFLGQSSYITPQSIEEELMFKAGQLLNQDPRSSESEIQKESLILYGGNDFLTDLIFETYSIFETSDSKLKIEDSPISKSTGSFNLDTKWFMSKLKSNELFWNKYKKLFEFLDERIVFFYQNGNKGQWYKTIEDIYRDNKIEESQKESAVNDFYKRVPEFNLYMQMLNTYWSKSVDIPLIRMNFEMASNGDSKNLTTKEMKKIKRQQRLESFLNPFTFLSTLNQPRNINPILVEFFKTGNGIHFKSSAVTSVEYSPEIEKLIDAKQGENSTEVSLNKYSYSGSNSFRDSIFYNETIKINYSFYYGLVGYIYLLLSLSSCCLLFFSYKKFLINAWS